jgi:O-Antigen ligase
MVLKKNIGSFADRYSSPLIQIALFTFLFPLFVSRIFIGKIKGSEYSSSILLPFQRIEPAIIIGLCLFLAYYLDKKFRWIPFLFLFLLFIQVFYFIGLHLSTEEPLNYLIHGIYVIIHVVSIAIFATFFFKENLFVLYFERACRVSLFFIIFTIVFYFVTDIAFQISLAPGYCRVQSFLSEPSALAPLLGSFLILSIRKNRKFDILLVIIAVIFARSPTVYLTILGSLMLYFVLNIKTHIKSIITLSSIIIIGVFLLRLTSIKKYINESKNPTIHSFKRLDRGVDDILALDFNGKNNVRLNLVSKAYRFLEDKKLTLTGFGLNATTAFNKIYNIYGNESSFWIYILSSYGIIGVIVFILITLVSCFHFATNMSDFSCIFFSYLIASSINAAGGIVTYKIVILGFMIAFSKINFKRNLTI